MRPPDVRGDREVEAGVPGSLLGNNTGASEQLMVVAWRQRVIVSGRVIVSCNFLDRPAFQVTKTTQRWRRESEIC